ncbi:hypothetical protein CK203_110144 [Vitis vinifera]|uniref:Cytidyltransferase-like domain-containing protein n=1 Tax=Vitis vinifera TaxID=29760 RepID=A0A438CB43_VITVI|nr:hypothetical protein CK203_110144 [Vitis vinifera]
MEASMSTTLVQERKGKIIHTKAIAYACKVPATFVSELTESEVYEECEKQFNEDEELEQLINGQICFKWSPLFLLFIVREYFAEANKSNADRKIILSGSFNPLHDGHLKLLDVATSICGHDGYPCFEISAVNADKPPLTVSQIKERVKQFERVGKTVIISTQPYFYKKAELFPGSAFVIGADTVVRLINMEATKSQMNRLAVLITRSGYPIAALRGMPSILRAAFASMLNMGRPKYYDGSNQKMLEILGGCKRTGCIFLVGGRNIDGVFKVLEDLEIPEELKDMFIPIPAERFRMDISSTEIRQKAENIELSD